MKTPPQYSVTTRLGFNFDRWQLSVGGRTQRDVSPGEAVALASMIGEDVERRVRATIAAYAVYAVAVAEREEDRLPETIAETMRSYQARKQDAEAAAEAAAEFGPEEPLGCRST